MPSSSCPAPARRAAHDPLLAVPALAAAAIATASATNAIGLPGACPFRLATGLDCPFCGGTRSLAAMARFDVLAAVDHNTLVVVALLIVGLWWVRRVRGTLRPSTKSGERSATRCGGSSPSPTHPSAMVVTVLSLVALVVFTVLRNLPGPPWHFLASGP